MPSYPKVFAPINGGGDEDSKIKAIIFDTDGVIFKSQDCNGKYLWSRNLKKDLGLSSQHCKLIYSKQWEKVTRGLIDIKNHLKMVFRDPICDHLTITPEQYIEYWLSHDNYLNQNIIQFAQLLQTDIFIGTNQDYYRTKHIKNITRAIFKQYFASYQIGYLKPEVNFFLHIEKALQLKPQNILLIDDTPINIIGASNRGWNTYLYQDDFENLKSFAETLKIL